MNEVKNIKLGDVVRVKTNVEMMADMDPYEEVFEGSVEAFVFGGEYIKVHKISMEGIYSEDGVFFPYSIIELVREMSLYDLRDGLIVRLRNGITGIWFKGNVCGRFTYFSGIDYHEDLTHADNSDWDIMKVYVPEKEKCSLMDMLSHKTLIWERKEKRKITFDEAVKVLEQIYGKDFEIVG